MSLRRSGRTPRRPGIVVTVAVCALLGVACGSDSEPREVSPTADPAPVVASGTPAGTEDTVEAVESDDGPAAAEYRLASARFVEVGDSVALSGHGTLEEVVHLTEPPAATVDRGDMVATHTGVSCAALRYRNVAGENGVQSLCLFVVEQGSCDSLPAARVDAANLDDRSSELGGTDLFASGSGGYYRVCTAESGTLRLETTDRAAPPLHAVVVDALTDGPYAVDDGEFDAVRSTAVPSLGGETVTPPLVVTVTREIDSLVLGASGAIEINDEDCAVVPSCSDRSDIVEPGDTLRVNYGIEPGAFVSAIEAASPEARDAFLADRIDMVWSDLVGHEPAVIEAAVARLISLEIMDEILNDFDELYGLRDRGIRVGLWPYWLATRSVSDFCAPDARAGCEAIEARIAAVEATRMEGWRASGLNLWWTGHLDARSDGVSSLADRRPAVDLFAGIDGIYLVNAEVPPDQRQASMRSIIEDLAAVAGAETPVMISMPGPPITANTGGEFCEADVCTSDFSSTFDYAETVLMAATDHLAPSQFIGFGVALFDGAHVDIREPVEDFGDYELNRLAETAFFNPVLNIWRSR